MANVTKTLSKINRFSTFAVPGAYEGAVAGHDRETGSPDESCLLEDRQIKILVIVNASPQGHKDRVTWASTHVGVRPRAGIQSPERMRVSSGTRKVA